MPDYTEIGAFNRFPENINILKDNKFKFVIRRIPQVSFFCSEVQLPEVKIPVKLIQYTPFNTLPLPSSRLDYSDLSLTFLVDEDLKNYVEILNWLRGITLVQDFTKYKETRQGNQELKNKFGDLWSDATLHILNNEGNSNINVVFKDAFPIFLSSLDFQSTGEIASPIVANVKFTYTFYDFEYPV